MGGAESQRLLAPALDRVDGDDQLRSGDPRALHDELPDPARADHERARAGRHPRREQGRADAGERRAAEERRLLAADTRLRSGSADPRVDDDALGQAAGRGAPVDRLAVERQPVVPSTSVPFPIAR